MKKFTGIYSAIKTRRDNVTINLRAIKQTLITKYRQEKENPRFKKKSAVLGFSTVIGVFLLRNVPAAIAKDIPDLPSKGLKKKPPVQQKTPPVQPSKIVLKQTIREGAAAMTGVICSQAFELASYSLRSSVRMPDRSGLLNKNWEKIM